MTESISDGLVRGTLHMPDEARREIAIVLAHGASSDSNAKLMVALATAFADAGVPALRIDLPFRQANKPPHPSTAARDREGLREAARLAGRYGKVIIGGLSYGGRQASMLAAEDPAVASGLLLLSYPLHPPGKPDQMRTAHFPQLHTKALFVHGSKDPFGSPEEMRRALELIPGKPEPKILEGGGHDLKPAVKNPQSVVELFMQSGLS